MKVVCAWCGKDEGETPPYEDKSTTHGICPDCAKRVEEEYKAKKRNE